MVQFFKELYFTCFTLAFRFRAPEKWGGGWGPEIDAGKGVALVSMIALMIFDDLVSWVEILVGTKLSFHSNIWITGAIALIFYLANYYILVTRGHGIKFERERFNSLKRTRKFFLVVSFAVLLLATMAFSFYSISTYHRLFHIIPKVS